MKKKLIYIIEIATGEWEDLIERPICAFSKKEIADQYVEKLNAELKARNLYDDGKMRRFDIDEPFIIDGEEYRIDIGGASVRSYPLELRRGLNARSKD